MSPVVHNPGEAREPERKEPANISLTGKIVANPVVSFRKEGNDGAILFNPDSDTVVLINIPGIVIWDCLSKPRTVEEIIEVVRNTYTNNPDRDSIKKDIESFVMDLSPEFIAEVEDDAVAPVVC
jgi:hypothetical protein